MEASNYIPPQRQAAAIIIYVNGEGRVIIIIYPSKIYPPCITTSRGGFVFPIDEQHERKGSVDDVAITTQREKCW